MYADGTRLAYASNTIGDITESMNIGLENLKKWLYGNKLTLNVAKTTSVIISKTKHWQNCFAYRGIAIWNSLPREIKSSRTFD